jgi:hypothetical protein
MDCARVLTHLASTGWSGDVVVEISTRRDRTAHERHSDLAASLTFARNYLRPDPQPYAPPAPEHHHPPADAW